MGVVSGHTIEAAQGRWREIFLALGVEARLLNRKPQPCPMCGGKDRFTFTDRNGDGDYICRGCGAGKGFRLLRALKGWEFKQAAHEVDLIIGNLPAAKPAPPQARAASRRELNELWLSGREIAPEDPAGRYLASRGVSADGLRRALRFVPRLLHHPTKTGHPAMVALFSDATGKAKQLQRLYLSKLGKKADIDPNRMFMPGPLPEGGAIRLGEPAEVMGIAEGVETALAAARRFGVPVWAASSSVMLENWKPPPEAKRIIVCGDNDRNAVGQAAAWELARKLALDKIEFEVRIPTAAGADWADEQ